MPARRPSPSMNKGLTKLIDGIRQKAVKRGERWRWVPVTQLRKRSPARSPGGRTRDSFWNKHCRGKEDEDCEMHSGSRSRVPNYCANQCKGERRKKFGVEYVSTQNDNGSWYWKRVDEGDDTEYSTNYDKNDSSTNSSNVRSVSSFPKQTVSPGKITVSVSKDRGKNTPSSIELKKGNQSIAFRTNTDTRIIENSYAHFEKPNTHVFAFWNDQDQDIDLYIIQIQPGGYFILSYSLCNEVSDCSKLEVKTEKENKQFTITTKSKDKTESYKYIPNTRNLLNDNKQLENDKLISHTFKSLFDAGD